MNAICKTNDAFKDSLTTGKAYKVLRLQNGSVLILNNLDRECWYGSGRFQLVPSAQSAALPRVEYA